MKMTTYNYQTAPRISYRHTGLYSISGINKIHKKLDIIGGGYA